MRRESEGTERGALLQPPPLPAVTITGSKRIKKGLQVPPSPPLVRWAGGRGRSLTQAGDVGTSARRCHDALGGAAWDVVVNLCACGRQEGRRVHHGDCVRCRGSGTGRPVPADPRGWGCSEHPIELWVLAAEELDHTAFLPTQTILRAKCIGFQFLNSAEICSALTPPL